MKRTGVGLLGLLTAIGFALGAEASPVTTNSSRPSESPAPVTDISTLRADLASADFPLYGWDWLDPILKDRVELGGRITYYWLIDDERIADADNFFGSINTLKDDQNYTPKPVIHYRFLPYLGIGLTFEQVRAVTWTRAEYDSAGNLTDGNYSDGTINLEGPLFYLFGKYPNTTPFTPYLELGVAYYSASWEANPAWRDSGGANSHIFVLDDTTGWAIGTGCEIAIYKGLCADIYWRYTEVDVGVHYYLYGKEQAINAEKRWRESFPMSNYAAGLGLKYVF